MLKDVNNQNTHQLLLNFKLSCKKPQQHPRHDTLLNENYQSYISPFEVNFDKKKYYKWEIGFRLDADNIGTGVYV